MSGGKVGKNSCFKGCSSAKANGLSYWNGYVFYTSFFEKEYRLAKEANLSHSTVANMFNRNNAPTFPTLEAICNAFQMTLSQFFCEDGNLIELTDEEKELISRWKQLSAEQRKVLLELMGVI